MADETEHICMQMIVHAGNARASAYRAAEQAAAGDFAAARGALAEADQELALAHRQHMAALAAEAQGTAAAPTLLLVHAEDQLMTATSERGLLEQVVLLHQRLAAH